MNPRLAFCAVLAIAFAVPATVSQSIPVAPGFDARLPSFVCHAEEVEATGVFRGVGIVTAIQAGTGALTLNHEDIKGLMPAMEMMYRVKSPTLAAGLAVGDKVRFDVDAKSYTILAVEKIAGK